MQTNQFLLDVANEIAAQRNLDIALIVSPDLMIIEAGHHARGAAGSTPNTALVNALSHASDGSVDLADCLCVCSYPPTPMCKGMKDTLRVKAAIISQGDKVPAAGTWAKEINDSDKERVKAHAKLKIPRTKRFMVDYLKSAFTTVPNDSGPGFEACPNLPTIYMHLVMAMLGTTWNPNKDHNKAQGSGNMYGGNNVAALLLEKDKIVAWGLNVMAQNKTFHAETIMLSAYFEKTNQNRLPSDTKVITSLQPCHMCGGFLAQVLSDSTKVIYGMKDGDLDTVLTKRGRERQLDVACDVPIWRRFAVQKLDGSGTESYAVPSVHPGTRKPVSKVGSIQGLRPDVPGPSTSVLVDRKEDAQPLGNHFAQFPRWLLDKNKDPSASVEEKKAVKHALELLRIVAISGMMTNYGIACFMAFTTGDLA